MASAELRRLRAADVEACAALEATGGARRWSRAQVIEELRLGVGIGAIDERGLAGHAFFRAQVHEWWLLQVRVAERARRLGVGSALLARGVELLPPVCSEVWLEVAADNTGAIALYEAAGFSLQGRRARYYGEIDALLMSRLP